MNNSCKVSLGFFSNIKQLPFIFLLLRGVVSPKSNLLWPKISLSSKDIKELLLPISLLSIVFLFNVCSFSHIS